MKTLCEKEKLLIMNEEFLLFPQSFLLNQINVSPFVHIFDIISLFVAELEGPKIEISGKGLTTFTSELINHNYSLAKNRVPSQDEET